MLSDEVIKKVIERLTRRIEQTNIYVLEEIGKSIKKIGTLTPTKAQQLIQIMRYGGDYDKIVKALAKMTNLSVKDIYSIFEEVARNDYMFSQQFYEYRNKKFIPFDENVALKTQVEALARQTANEFVNMTKTMAFANVVNGKVVYSPLAETYQNILDKAFLSVAQGKTTFDQELHKAIKELASNGIKTANYESGRVLRLDSAVRMQMKDALRTLHNETQQIVGKDFDSDGVEISVHLNPAPDHEDVQGKQFSNEEFEKFQNDQDAISYDGIEFSADYENHDRRSIGQYNCYHYVFSIVLGVSKPQYTNKQLKEIKRNANKKIEIDGKKYTRYECTQLQRHLELEIRKQKDQQIIALASGDEQLAGESQNKIRVLTKKYKELSDASGLPTKVKRMRVSGYKRNAKASESYNEFINKMKVGEIDVSKFGNEFNPTTKVIILRPDRYEHIFADHPKEAPLYIDRVKDVLNNYDNAYKENGRKSTLWLVKKYDDFELNMVIKINETSLYQKKELGYKNSIMSFYPIRNNYLKNSLKNGKITKLIEKKENK